jgi:hypothetical protein
MVQAGRQREGRRRRVGTWRKAGNGSKQQRQRSNVPGAEGIGYAGSGVGHLEFQYRSCRGAADENAMVQRVVVQV